MESDARYFDRRPRVTSRIREPFPGELRTLPVLVAVPPGHAVVVIVAVRRDTSTGSLLRARGIAVIPLGTSMLQ